MMVILSENLAVDPKEVVRVDAKGMISGVMIYMRDGTKATTSGTAADVAAKLNAGNGA